MEPKLVIVHNIQNAHKFFVTAPEAFRANALFSPGNYAIIKQAGGLP